MPNPDLRDQIAYTIHTSPFEYLRDSREAADAILALPALALLDEDVTDALAILTATANRYADGLIASRGLRTRPVSVAAEALIDAALLVASRLAEAGA